MSNCKWVVGLGGNIKRGNYGNLKATIQGPGILVQILICPYKKLNVCILKSKRSAKIFKQMNKTVTANLLNASHKIHSVFGTQNVHHKMLYCDTQTLKGT